MPYDPECIAEFVVNLPVKIRIGREEDLSGLEWFGAYTPHREIIQDAYEQQQRGEGAILVAEAGGFPVGQVWINLERKSEEAVGIIWALRVLLPLRRHGIATRLMSAAEQLLADKGFQQVELGVAKAGVGRFYEQLGYCPVGTLREEYSYTTPDGEFMRVPVHQTIYRKELTGRRPGAEL